MVLKGQIEFVVILAMLAIGVVAAVVVLQTGVINPPTPGVEKQYETIKNSITDLIRSGAVETMDTLYSQGGFLSPEKTITYGYSEVPVWRDCSGLNVPRIEDEIRQGVMNYLNKNLNGTMDFFGKTVKLRLSVMNVQPNLVKNRIDIKVTIPTDVDGYTMPQPYEVSVPTNLYDIMDFSSNFIKDADKARMFEQATMTFLATQDFEKDTPQWIPLTGVRVGCGNILLLTKEDIRPRLERFLKQEVPNRINWNNVPASPDSFFFNSVGGKTYPNIDVTFVYPDSWDIGQNMWFTSGGSPNMIYVMPSMLFYMVPVCTAQYYVSYSFRYPIIVRVKDRLNGRNLDFAYMAEIQNNAPAGNCSDYPAPGQTEYDQMCVQGATMPVLVTVKDTEGNPVQDAQVTFSMCLVGRTNASGMVEGHAPGIGSDFHVYKQGYKSFANYTAGNMLQNVTVVLKSVQETVNIHIFGVPVTGEGASLAGESVKYSSYRITSGPSGITDHGDLMLFSYFVPTDPDPLVPEDSQLSPSLSDEEGNLADSVEINGLFPNEYTVYTVVQDNAKSMITGAVNSTFTLGENDRDIYMYLPVLKNEDMQYSINGTEGERLASKLISCGIKPVSTEEQSLSGSCN